MLGVGLLSAPQGCTYSSICMPKLSVEGTLIIMVRCMVASHVLYNSVHLSRLAGKRIKRLALRLQLAGQHPLPLLPSEEMFRCGIGSAEPVIRLGGVMVLDSFCCFVLHHSSTRGGREEAARSPVLQRGRFLDICCGFLALSLSQRDAVLADMPALCSNTSRELWHSVGKRGCWMAVFGVGILDEMLRVDHLQLRTDGNLIPMSVSLAGA